MFEYIEGIVKYKKLDYLAVDVGGIGYKIYISIRTYENVEVSNKYRLYVYNAIKEDSYKLIGFLEERERKLFEMLLTVKGIGVSLGLAIMSTFSYDKVIDLIRKDDFVTLKKVPKLGEKKSQYLILDLKNKIKKLNLDASEDISMEFYDMEEDIILALSSLGYGDKEISKIIKQSDLNKYNSIEEAIKNILKNIKEGD